MQPRFTVGVLVLQAERLVSTIRYLGFLFQTTPAGVVAEPQELAVLIGHLARDADLVAVEVVGLLSVFAVFVGPVMYLRQRFVGIRVCVDIGISAVRLDFLQEVAAVPKRSGCGFRGRLKLPDWFSDGLCLSFCPGHRRCRPTFLSCRLF